MPAWRWRVGSRVVPAEALAHDQAVARISHLPHLMALALAQVGEHGGALALSLAASSFADATRVAGTRPELIRAMCETNRDALIDAMDDALGIMGVARGSLASTGSLFKIAEAGHLAVDFDDRAGSRHWTRRTSSPGEAWTAASLSTSLLGGRGGPAGTPVSGITAAPSQRHGRSPPRGIRIDGAQMNEYLNCRSAPYPLHWYPSRQTARSD